MQEILKFYFFSPPKSGFRRLTSGMGKGNGNGRERGMGKDEPPKFNKAALKGLSFDKGNQPAFLRNAYAALAGPSTSTSGRPGIPERPSDNLDGDKESDEDEWDMGRGEEAPTIVVLKESKHLDREEVERIRAEGERSAGLL